jgi:hypothetical protein
VGKVLHQNEVMPNTVAIAAECGTEESKNLKIYLPSLFNFAPKFRTISYIAMTMSGAWYYGMNKKENTKPLTSKHW